MSSSDRDSSGWLPPDPGDEMLPLPPPRSRSRGGVFVAFLAIVMTTVAAAAAVLTGTGGSGERPAPADQTPSWPAPRTASSVPQNPGDDLRPTVWTTDPFLRGLDLDLFARDETVLYRIRAGSGQVVATRTPYLDSNGVVTLLAGPDRVLAINGARSGWLVPDGQAATTVAGPLADIDYAVPGPAGTIWATRTVNGKPVTTLTDFTGQPVNHDAGPVMYRDGGWTATDGAAGLLLHAPGGTYRLTSNRPRRVTTGRVIATGPNHMLAVECDTRLLCSRVLLDRTGHRRRISATTPDDSATGTISRTGRYAALTEFGSTGDAGWDRVTIIDLDTATTISSFDPQNVQQDAHSLIWLPNNRLLGLRNGQIYIFDPSTRRFTTPNLRLPSQLLQLTIRLNN